MLSDRSAVEYRGKKIYIFMHVRLETGESQNV